MPHCWTSRSRFTLGAALSTLGRSPIFTHSSDNRWPRSSAVVIRGSGSRCTPGEPPHRRAGSSRARRGPKVSAHLPVWGLLHLVQPPSRLGTRLGLVRDTMVTLFLARFDRLLTVSRAGALQPCRSLCAPRASDNRSADCTEASPPVSLSERRFPRATHYLPATISVGAGGIGSSCGRRALTPRCESPRSGSSTGFPYLVVIGDGPDLPAIRRLAERMGLDSSVTFLGWRRTPRSNPAAGCRAAALPLRGPAADGAAGSQRRCTRGSVRGRWSDRATSTAVSRSAWR